MSTSHVSIQGQQLHPYHIQSVQELAPRVAPAKHPFCLKSLCLQQNESCFARTGIANIHMTIIMRLDFTISHDSFPSTCGWRLHRKLSHFAHLSGRDYLHFLRTCLRWLFEDTSMSLNLRLHVWLQQGGAPLYHTEVRCVNGTLKFILDAELVADVNLEFLGLHAHLTLILSTVF
jgi:hypothetical protein